MTTWIAIGLTVAGCYLVKLLGLSIPAALLERPVIHRLSVLLPVALLAALTVLQTVDDGSGSLALDARVVGIAAAGVALLLRAPFLLVVAVAVGGTALARALGG